MDIEGAKTKLSIFFDCVLKNQKEKKHCFNSLSRHDNFSNLKDTKMPGLKLPQ